MLLKSVRMKNVKLLLSLLLILTGIFASRFCCAAKPVKEKEEELGLESIEDPSKPIFFTMNKEKWQPAPAHFPPGVQLLVLAGNPDLPTTFTMRLKLPANHEIPAHWHPSDENVTVISGKLMLGLGDKLEKNKKAKELPAGSYARIPAKMHHYGWTNEETVLQLTGHGPWHVHFLESDPSEREVKNSSEKGV